MPRAEWPDTAFARLAARRLGERSVNQAEVEAGVPRGTVNNYLKPSGIGPRPDREFQMPLRSTIDRIARVVGASVQEVSDAFHVDADLPTPTVTRMSRLQQQVVRLLAEMGDESQRTVRDVTKRFYAYDVAMRQKGRS